MANKINFAHVTDNAFKAFSEFHVNMVTIEHLQAEKKAALKAIDAERKELDDKVKAGTITEAQYIEKNTALNTRSSAAMLKCKNGCVEPRKALNKFYKTMPDFKGAFVSFMETGNPTSTASVTVTKTKKNGDVVTEVIKVKKSMNTMLMDWCKELGIQSIKDADLKHFATYLQMQTAGAKKAKAEEGYIKVKSTSDVNEMLMRAIFAYTVTKTGVWVVNDDLTLAKRVKG